MATEWWVKIGEGLAWVPRFLGVATWLCWWWNSWVGVAMVVVDVGCNGYGYGFVGVGGSGLLILWIVPIGPLFQFSRFFLLVFFFSGFLVELEAAVMVIVVWWCRDGGCDGGGGNLFGVLGLVA